MIVTVTQIYTQKTTTYSGSPEQVLHQLHRDFPWASDQQTVEGVVDEIGRAQAFTADLEDEAPAPTDLDKAAGGAERGRVHVNLAVGTMRDGKIKVKHPDTGVESWVSVRSGLVQNQTTGSPASAKHPG